MTLVYIEINNGQIKKSSLEAVNYAVAVAKVSGVSVTAVAIGPCDHAILETLGKYGATKVVHVESITSFENNTYAEALAQIAKKEGAKNIIISNTYSGKSIAPRLAVKMNASILSGAVDMPDTSNGFSVKKGVFFRESFCLCEYEP